MASPVPLFNGLKHLPCPKEAGGAACSTSGCLFGHRSDNNQASTSTRPRSQAIDGAADAEDDPGPAQKRQRLNPASDAQQLIINDGLATATEKVKESDLYDPFSTPTVGEVSKDSPKAATPSPLKTTSTPTPPSQSPSLSQTNPATPLISKVCASTNRSACSSKTTKPRAAQSLASPLAHSSTILKRTSQRPNGTPVGPIQAGLAKSPRKDEALNPRHVASAPASHSVRYQLLKLLHTEMVRLNSEVSARVAKEHEYKQLIRSAQELVWAALDIEEKVAKDKGPIYKNIMGQEVMAHKRMDVAAYIAERKRQLALTVQSQLRGGKQGGASGSNKQTVPKDLETDRPVVIDTGLSAAQEVQLLGKLLTPTTKLEAYGYVSTPPTEEELAKTAEAVGWSKDWEQCDRCNARFQVYPDGHLETGELTSGGACTHHPGKLFFPVRQAGHTGLMNKKYRCCTQELNESPGCATTDRHVWKTSDTKRLAMLWNWVETPANNSPSVKKVVAFDCEMGYTVRGMELLRVTATSWPDGAELIDVLVQPFGRILDLNSMWSGVFMEDLVRGVPWTKAWEPPTQKPGERKILRKVDSPRAARDLLFSVISPDTVLIGHGLENDLNAMRMIHPKVVDTVLLYPHRRGLPLRMSLKALMETHLNRRIQNDTNGNGHDSAEDARAAGDLVRLQVQKKWKVLQSEGWRFLDGILRKSGWESPDSEDKGAQLTVEVPEARCG